MPPLLLKLLFTMMPRRAPALMRPLVGKIANGALTTLVNPQLKQHMAFWEGELGKSEWFAGNDFSAADIQMSFPLEAASARAGLSRDIPRRWHGSNAFMRGRPMRARSKKAGRIRWDADAKDVRASVTCDQASAWSTRPRVSGSANAARKNRL